MPINTIYERAWRCTPSNGWNCAYATKSYNSQQNLYIAGTNSNILYELIFNSNKLSSQTRNKYNRYYLSNKSYKLTTVCGATCGTNSTSHSSFGDASLSITTMFNSTVNYNRNIYEKNHDISLPIYFYPTTTCYGGCYIKYDANSKLKEGIHHFILDEYDFNINGYCSYVYDNIYNATSSHSIGWQTLKDVNNVEYYIWNDRCISVNINKYNIDTYFLYHHIYYHLIGNGGYDTFDELDYYTTYSEITQSLKNQSNIKFLYKKDYIYDLKIELNNKYKQRNIIDNSTRGNYVFCNLILSTYTINNTTYSHFDLVVSNTTNNALCHYPTTTEHKTINDYLYTIDVNHTIPNINYETKDFLFNNGNMFSDKLEAILTPTIITVSYPISYLTSIDDVDYLQSNDITFITAVTSSTQSTIEIAESIDINTNADYYPIGGDKDNKIIDIKFKRNNFVYKYIDYAYFNLEFVYRTDNITKPLRVYLSDNLPSLRKDNVDFDGTMIASITASNNTYSFYGLYGNKYLYFVAPYNTIESDSISCSLYNIKIIGGYDENYCNSTISTCTLTSSTSTFSFVYGYGNTYDNTAYTQTLYSKIGNGRFKAGIWENGVWNNGIRDDDNMYIFNDITQIICENKSNIWFITINGSSYSTSHFNVGDKISIGNIVTIDINNNRKLIDKYLIIQSLTNTSLTVRYVCDFPIINIKKDSSNHNIYITKNIWLNGIFFNGTFKGVWNNGMFKGYPLISDMKDSQWIDGVFDGGHFIASKQAGIDCIISYTFSTPTNIFNMADFNTEDENILTSLRISSGKLMIKCSKTHNLGIGDIITLCYNDKKYNTTVKSVIDDYTIITNLDYNNSNIPIFIGAMNTTASVNVNISNGLIQNMTFNANNISNVTSVKSNINTDVFLYDSWMDINYYTYSAVNIGKDNTNNSLPYIENVKTLENISDGINSYTLSNALNGFVSDTNTQEKIELKNNLFSSNLTAITYSNILKNMSTIITKDYKEIAIIKKDNQPSVENNLYGYPTNDILSSISYFRNSYNNVVKSYKLGTKYTIYHDYIGDAGEFKEYFTDFKYDYMEENGWTYSIYKDSSIIFNRTTGDDLDSESVIASTTKVKNKELKITAYNKGGVLNILHDDNLSIFNRYNGKVENGRYTMISFDLLTYSSNEYVKSNSDYYPLIHFNNLNIKRYANKEPLYKAKAYMTLENKMIKSIALDNGNIKNVYDSDVSLKDEPFTYLPINTNIDHTKTTPINKVEYFYNKTELAMNFRGTSDSNGYSQYVIDNLHFYEVDMIPFFQYFTYFNIDRGVVVPYCGIAPYIKYTPNSTEFINNISYGYDSVIIKKMKE